MCSTLTEGRGTGRAHRGQAADPSDPHLDGPLRETGSGVPGEHGERVVASGNEGVTDRLPVRERTLGTW